MAKRDKMVGKEVSLGDVILDMRELKTKVYDLTQKWKEIRKELEGLKSKVSSTKQDLDSRSPGEIFVGGPRSSGDSK